MESTPVAQAADTPCLDRCLASAYKRTCRRDAPRTRHTAVTREVTVTSLHHLRRCGATQTPVARVSGRGASVPGTRHEAMYRANADFVFTVTRGFVRACQTPILVLPDDVPAHPYAVAMETVHLAPNAQVSLYPWKATLEQIPLAVRHVRSFLRAQQPVAAAH